MRRSGARCRGWLSSHHGQPPANQAIGGSGLAKSRSTAPLCCRAILTCAGYQGDFAVEQDELEQQVQAIYSRVNMLWNKHKSAVFEGHCGFHILSGPPIYQPELLIVGANPGFGSNDRIADVPETWPKESYIKTAVWPLAERLRALLHMAGRLDILERTLQTNFLFFKSHSLDKQPPYGWKTAPINTRREIETCCRAEVAKIINLIRPKMILVLGLAVFDKHAIVEKNELWDRAHVRRLAASGKVDGVDAIGITHPTGAQVATEDWSRVAKYLANRIALTT